MWTFRTGQNNGFPVLRRHLHPHSIIGNFTLPNATRPVTVEARVLSPLGSLESSITIPITDANTTYPASFTIPYLPSGTYSLIFTKPGHTTFTINNITITAGYNQYLDHDPRFPYQLPLMAGNVTGSGQVNVMDLNVLLQNWMGDYENANFTASGQINIVDLNILMHNWMAEAVVVD